MRAPRSGTPRPLLSVRTPGTLCAGRAQLEASGHVYRDYSTQEERDADRAESDRAKRATAFAARSSPKPSSSNTRPKGVPMHSAFRCRSSARWLFTT